MKLFMFVVNYGKLVMNFLWFLIFLLDNPFKNKKKLIFNHK